MDKDFSHRRFYSPDTVSFISTMENAKEAALRRSAMKILSQHYHEVNKIRNEIVMDTEDELKKNNIVYEIAYNGNTKIIISETPYGTVAFYPLTRKIQRNSYMTEGDTQIYVSYLNWLRLQWEIRNPSLTALL